VWLAPHLSASHGLAFLFITLYIAIMKELMRTTDPTMIAYAQAILQGEDIITFEVDVHMSVLDGSLGILPRRLMVRDCDHFMATAALRDNDIPTGA
jgi:hypothetical protein